MLDFKFVRQSTDSLSIQLSVRTLWRGAMNDLFNFSLICSNSCWHEQTSSATLLMNSVYNLIPPEINSSFCKRVDVNGLTVIMYIQGALQGCHCIIFLINPQDPGTLQDWPCCTACYCRPAPLLPFFGSEKCLNTHHTSHYHNGASKDAINVPQMSR